MRVGLACIFVLLGAVRASSHVVVLPSRSVADGAERYSVIVPTEGDSATTRVEVRLPPGVKVAAVEAKPGWKGTYAPFPIGAATVRWSGGRILPGEMMSFDFLATNPHAAGTLTWNATQSYEDGTSERWGEGGSPEHEASTTTLVADDTLPPRAHDADHPPRAADAQMPAVAATPVVAATATHVVTALPVAPPASESPALWIAGVALLIALTALVVTVRGARDRGGPRG